MESLFLQQFFLGVSKKHNTMSQMYGGTITDDMASAIPAYYQDEHYVSKHSHRHFVPSYHISSHSLVYGKNMSQLCKDDSEFCGIVLYLKNGKTEWHCNGVHCRIGYIIIKNMKHLNNNNNNNNNNNHNSSNNNNSIDMMSEEKKEEKESSLSSNNSNYDNDMEIDRLSKYYQLYKSVFNCDATDDVVACGFIGNYKIVQNQKNNKNELKINKKQWIWDVDIFANENENKNNMNMNDSKSYFFEHSVSLSNSKSKSKSKSKLSLSSHHLIKLCDINVCENNIQSKRGYDEYSSMREMEHKAVIKSFENFLYYNIPTTYFTLSQQVWVYCQEKQKKCKKIWHSTKKFYNDRPINHNQSYLVNADTTHAAAAVDCVIQ